MDEGNMSVFPIASEKLPQSSEGHIKSIPSITNDDSHVTQNAPLGEVVSKNTSTVDGAPPRRTSEFNPIKDGKFHQNNPDEEHKYDITNSCCGIDSKAVGSDMKSQLYTSLSSQYPTGAYEKLLGQVGKEMARLNMDCHSLSNENEKLIDNLSKQQFQNTELKEAKESISKLQQENQELIVINADCGSCIDAQRKKIGIQDDTIDNLKIELRDSLEKVGNNESKVRDLRRELQNTRHELDQEKQRSMNIETILEQERQGRSREIEKINRKKCEELDLKDIQIENLQEEKARVERELALLKRYPPLH